MNIATLLPSATEIVCALGLEKNLVEIDKTQWFLIKYKNHIYHPFH